MSFTTCLVIMGGGALGTLARYLISVLTAPASQQLPMGTIGINIAGSFLIAFFGTLTLAHGRFPVSENTRLFVMVGICGGFTTFSSFSLQTLDLLRNGAVVRAGLNIGASVLFCVCAAALGHAAATHWNGGDPRISQVAVEEEANLEGEA